MESLPGGQDEGEGRGAGCLASHQTRRCPHTGAGAGEIYTWMDTCNNKPNRWMYGLKIGSWMDGWMDGWIDWWMDRLVDGLPLDGWMDGLPLDG